MGDNQEQFLSALLLISNWLSEDLFFLKIIEKTRNVTVCNRCPQRSLVRNTPSHYALSFCDVSLNLLQ